MPRFCSNVVCYGTGIGVILFGVLMLGGCDVFDTIAELLRFDNEAEAQQEFQVQTFNISAGSFFIETDAEPNVEVQDGTTIYSDFDDNTRLTFTPVGDSSQTIELDPEDTVIERPGVNMVTVIRAP